MSLFGKIKSAVMGNPVTREYEVGKHVASAGPGLLWKVYNGIKKSTRQEVSVFMFHKQTPEFEKMPKKRREALCEMLKKGPTHLVKLRHPRLLTIHHTVEESNDCLAFATEPIFASLANVLGHYDNLPSPLPLVIKEHELRPVEIQYGLLEVAEALLFLHTDVKMMHGNLTPESIVINVQGAWKLMGFNFCCYSHYQSEAQTTFAFREWDSRRPLHTNPSLDYLAPEYILSKSCNEQSDVYSLGMLCYAAYNQGKPLYENQTNMLSFKQNIELISRITESTLGQLPVVFKPLVRSALAVEPSVRPDTLQFTKHPFFEEVAVSTLRYLDMLFERGDMEKSQFFKKNLARVLPKLPKRVVHQRVLPALSGEFRNPKMIPFILPLTLLIADDCTMHEYATLIFPVLIPALQVQDPIQVPIIFLQKMDLLLKKTSPDDVKRYILPMIITSLEANNSQLQELCVSILPSFANMVDYSSMKHSIVPRMTALCIQTGTTSLRIKCLVSMGQMLDILDKHIVLDHILPILEHIPSREPGVLMGMLGIYHQTLVNKKLGMDKMMLATRVLPFLIPISIEPTLNLKQFNQFMLVIKDMLQRVETEQQSHLDQLSKMEEQTKSTVEFAREVAETKAMDDALNQLDEMFGSSGSHDNFTSPRVGSPPSQVNAMSDTSGTASGSAESADLFAGLMVSEPRPATMATSSSPLTPSPAAPPTVGAGNKPSPQISRSEQFKPTPVQTHPQPSSSTTSYAPPTLQPQTAPPLQPQTAPPLQPQTATSYTPPPLQPQTATSYTPPSLQPQTATSYTPPSLQPQTATSYTLPTLRPQTATSYTPPPLQPTSYTPPSLQPQTATSYTPPTLRPQTATSYTPPLQPTSYMPPPLQPPPTATSYMSPPLRPQTAAVNNSSSTSGVILDGLLSSNQNHTARSTGPTSWSSNLLTPSSSAGLSTVQTGSQNPSAVQPGSNADGLFSGMHMGSSLTPTYQTTALMGGTTSIPQQASASSFQSQKQQPSSYISLQHPPTSNMANQTRLATPLVPTQQSNVNTGRGWSTSIQGQSSPSVNIQGDLTAQEQSTVTPQMGWSSNIAARPQLQAANSVTGWSQNIGMGQPQGQMGMGWAGNMQGSGASQGVAGQQTAASIMMGAGQPLLPQGTSRQPQQQPTPSANPFADWNFLS